MATYRMQDGTVVKTENAVESWNEASDWNGSNHIGRSSCSQWHDHTMHKSKKNRYWLEKRSRVQGESEYAEWLSPEEATRWLMLNDIELPDDLKQYEEQVSE